MIVAKLFTTFVVRSVEVDGYSMSTTLMDGDKALTDALFFRMGKITRFDIVIVKMENGITRGRGLGKTKKEAEQNAAKEALKKCKHQKRK